MRKRGPYSINAVRSTETEQELRALLEMAKSGEIIGLAYVALRPGQRDPAVGLAGLAKQNPASAFFWLKRLALKLLISKQV